MGLFRKSAPGEPMAVTMAGVKLGQRLVAVGVRDPNLVAQLAVKVGLTGRACVVDDDDARLAKAAADIEKEGALVEPVRAPYGMWPLDPDSFDIAVIPYTLSQLPADDRVRCLSEVFRVLRPGGRVVVIEPARRGGFGALLHRQPGAAPGESLPALRLAGFAAVRELAEADGVAYLEGVKSSQL